MTLQIEPLVPRVHGDALYRIFHHPDHLSVWDYLRDGPFASAEALSEHLGTWIALPHVNGFIFRDGSEGDLRGIAGLITRDLQQGDRQTGRFEELAFVMFDPLYHGTGVATDGIRLLIAQALSNHEVQGCLWRCDIHNVASNRFARKLGFEPYAVRFDGEVKGKLRVSRFFRLLRT